MVRYFCLLAMGAGMLLIVGCGSYNANPPDEPTTGTVRILVDWAADGAGAATQQAPEAGNSVKVEFFDGQTQLPDQTVLIPRPQTMGVLPAVPAGAHLLRAGAYAAADGTGVARAAAQMVLQVAGGATTDAALALSSTVQSVEVFPSPASVRIGDTTTLGATAKDADGNTVLVQPTDAFAWTIESGAAVASVGEFTGVLTGLQAGKATVRATEQGSGVSGQGTVNVATETGNEPPQVDGGADREVTLPATAELSGTVTDDGNPNPPGAVTSNWSKVSGPGFVTFDPVDSAATTATVTASGAYVLRLTADDGELQASDEVSVTVAADPAGHWEELQTVNPPSPCKGHTLMPIDGALYIFGGTAGTEVSGIGWPPGDGVATQGFLNDLWAYDSESSEWQEVPGSDPPPARKGHAAAALGGKLYVYAGTAANGQILADLWCFDPATQLWQQQLTGQQLPRATGSRAVVANHAVYFVGGRNANGPIPVIFKYDPAAGTWTFAATIPSDRLPADSAGVAVLQGAIVWVGGTTPDTVCMFDFRSGYTARQAVTGATPSARTDAAFASDGNYLYQLGGSQGGLEFADVWSYCPGANAWTQRAVGPAHSGCAAVVTTPAGPQSSRIGAHSGTEAVLHLAGPTGDDGLWHDWQLPLGD